MKRLVEWMEEKWWQGNEEIEYSTAGIGKIDDKDKGCWNKMMRIRMVNLESYARYSLTVKEMD